MLEALWAESSRKRQRACRRYPVQGASGVEVHRGERGTYFGGLQTCGHSTCPICGPAMRQAERQRIQAIVGAHLAAGGQVYTMLLSLSHGPFDALDALLDALAAGRSRAIGGKGGGRWARDRKRFGIAGCSWHLETVKGRNGWHPHLHVLLFTDRVLDAAEVGRMQSRVFGRYRDGLRAEGFTALESCNQVQLLRSPDAIADYLTKGDKLGAVAAGIAAEVSRGDLKRGHGLTPSALLYRFTQTGDTADLNAFRDHEHAMRGRRWRSISPALTKRYAPDGAAGLSAEEQDRLDSQTVQGGEHVATISLPAWGQITRTPGAVSRVRALADRRDLDGLNALIREAEARAVAGRDRPPRRGAWTRHGTGI